MSAGSARKSRPPLTTFGFLNINKPAGITAHDVVAIVRKTLGIKQVGHAGTLDPMAQGVLPVAVGKATRLIRFLAGDKTYLAEMRLGLRTTTDDITGEPLAESDRLPDIDQLRLSLSAFNGLQKQTPPLYSAVHVGGQRLYELARKGQAPESVPEREVTIFALTLLSYVPPLLTARIHCSSGTYIRSIARDLGDQLNCGGCLSGLIREQAGPFRLDNALSLDSLKETVADGRLSEAVTAPQEVLNLPAFAADADQTRAIAQGKVVEFAAATTPEIAVGATPCVAQQYVSILNEGRLIAIGKTLESTSGELVRIQPEVVLIDVANPNH